MSRHFRLGSSISLIFALVTTLACATRNANAAPPTHLFRITGTAVNARDGSPVPYCRIFAWPAPNATAAASGGKASSAQDNSGPGLRAGGPGRGGGAPFPGRGGGRFGINAENAPRTVADVSGHFTLELPGAGAWAVAGEARGFRSQTFEQHDDFSSAVILTESSPLYSLSLHLQPDSLLSGLVLDEAGEPVESAQVVAELVPEQTPGSPPSEPRRSGFAQTDDRGRYEISGMEPGTYRLRVQATPWYSSASHGRQGMIVLSPNLSQGSSEQSSQPDPLDVVYPVTWYPGTDDVHTAETVSLHPGESRQADFHLTPVAAAHLRVQNPDPPPVYGNAVNPRMQATASLMRIENDGQGQMTMSTSFNGAEVQFGGLAPGTYELSLPSQGSGRGPDQVREVIVRPGARDLTLEAAKPLTPVTILVDGDSRAGGMVDLVDLETGRRFSALPPRNSRGGMRGGPDFGPAWNAGADDGASGEPRTRVAMVEGGRYEVVVQSSGGAYLTGISAEGASVAGRTVTISGPAHLTLHVANARAEVHGVAAIAGKPVTAAMVLLVPATLGQSGNLREIVRAQTNTDGSFLLRNVAPGPYILLAIDRGWDVNWRRLETLAPYLLHGKPLELAPSAQAHQDLEAVVP